MEHNAKNICKTIISGEEQNLNKQMVEFRISILFQYFVYILARFNTISKSWKPILQFNTFSIHTFNTLHGNPSGLGLGCQPVFIKKAR